MSQDKAIYPYTCYLLESHLWHEEIFPQWINWLNRLGFFVYIYTRQDVIDRDATPWVPKGGFAYRLWEPGAPPDTSECDLLVVNTLSGFMNDSIQALMVEDLAPLDVPAISYIHEPMFWVSRFPVHELYVTSPEKKYRFHLLRDGTYIPDQGPISDDHWSLEGDLFQVPIEGNLIQFQRAGDRWKAREGDLWADFLPAPLELYDYLKPPQRAAYVCTGHSKVLMNGLFPSVDFLFPTYFGDLPPVEQRQNYCITGEIDYGRKDYVSLTDAAETIKQFKDDKVIIVGGNRLLHTIGKNRHENRLKQEIMAHGLEDKIEFTGYLGYREFFKHLNQCRFILPLIDRRRDGGTYFTKLAGAIAFSIGLGVPMVLDQELAELYGVEFMPTYTDGDLASGIAQAEQMGPAEYAALCQQTLALRDQIAAQNFEKLENFIRMAIPRAIPSL